MTRDLEPAAEDELPVIPKTGAERAGDAGHAGHAQPAARSPPIRHRPAPTAAPDPTLTLTPEQHDFLATGATATLAVNDPSGAPQLTSSMYHWDGSTLRLPGKMFTARATNIDRDPRVSVLIEDAASGAWWP